MTWQEPLQLDLRQRRRPSSLFAVGVIGMSIAARLVMKSFITVIGLFTLLLSACEPADEIPLGQIEVRFGEVIPDDERPYVGALFSRVGDSAFFVPICTATLIGPVTLVTAAHCVFAEEGGNLRFARQFNLSDTGYGFSALGPGSATHGIRSIHIHSGFNPRDIFEREGIGRDIALLSLRNPAPIQEFPDWQRTHLALQFAAELEVVGYGDSHATLGSGTKRRGMVAFVEYSLGDAVMVVARGGEGQNLTCSGDSGGPVLLPGEDRIVAISSTNDDDDCTRASRAGLKTTASATEFMGQTMQEIADDDQRREIFDANGDGSVNSTDLIYLFLNCEYEGGQTDIPHCDFTGDDRFTSSDLVALLQSGFYE